VPTYFVRGCVFQFKFNNKTYQFSTRIANFSQSSHAAPKSHASTNSPPNESKTFRFPIHFVANRIIRNIFLKGVFGPNPESLHHLGNALRHSNPAASSHWAIAEISHQQLILLRAKKEPPKKASATKLGHYCNLSAVWCNSLFGRGIVRFLLHVHSGVATAKKRCWCSDVVRCLRDLREDMKARRRPAPHLIKWWMSIFIGKSSGWGYFVAHRCLSQWFLLEARSSETDGACIDQIDPLGRAEIRKSFECRMHLGVISQSFNCCINC